MRVESRDHLALFKVNGWLVGEVWIRSLDWTDCEWGWPRDADRAGACESNSGDGWIRVPVLRMEREGFGLAFLSVVASVKLTKKRLLAVLSRGESGQGATVRVVRGTPQRDLRQQSYGSVRWVSTLPDFGLSRESSPRRCLGRCTPPSENPPHCRLPCTNEVHQAPRARSIAAIGVKTQRVTAGAAPPHLSHPGRSDVQPCELRAHQRGEAEPCPPGLLRRGQRLR